MNEQFTLICIDSFGLETFVCCVEAIYVVTSHCRSGRHPLFFYDSCHKSSLVIKAKAVKIVKEVKMSDGS